MYLYEVYLLCNSRFPRAMSFKFIPLMAEVHKALLYKDNEAWHFLEISANGSSLIFHQKLCYMFSTENSVEKCLFIIKPKFLGKRSRKLTSKKKKTCPMRPLFSGKNVTPFPRSFAEKTERDGACYLPRNSHVLGLFIHFCVEFCLYFLTPEALQ